MAESSQRILSLEEFQELVSPSIKADTPEVGGAKEEPFVVVSPREHGTVVGTLNLAGYSFTGAEIGLFKRETIDFESQASLYRSEAVTALAITLNSDDRDILGDEIQLLEEEAVLGDMISRFHLSTVACDHLLAMDKRMKPKFEPAEPPKIGNEPINVEEPARAKRMARMRVAAGFALQAVTDIPAWRASIRESIGEGLRQRLNYGLSVVNLYDVVGIPPPADVTAGLSDEIIGLCNPLTIIESKSAIQPFRPKKVKL